MNSEKPTAKEKQNELIDRFVNKSIEAFILGLEVFNKPTIRYRIEGFSFFICNAWELMLKAKLLKDGQPITFAKNPNRSLDLTTVVGRVYTDKYQPLRLNLEKIIQLRNIATHYITADYETIYAPFFQANVINFVEQIRRFHKVDMTQHISQNFLTLSVNIATLTGDEIQAKYTPEMAAKLLEVRDDADYLKGSSSSNDLYIPIRTDIYVTKDAKKADLQVALDSSSDAHIRIVKDLKNPNETHTLSHNNVIDAVNKQLSARSIPLNYSDGKGVHVFNQHCLQLFIRFYGVKANEKYAFPIVLSDGASPVYKYSQQFVDFIVSEVKKDADLIEKIKSASKLVIAPGA